MVDEDRKARKDDNLADRTRTGEREDVADADAPPASEENEGMSTILSADPVDGVQDDADDE
jgi:hypothetical protein